LIGSAQPRLPRPHLRRAGQWLIVATLSATVLVPVVLGGREALDATMHFSIQNYLAIFSLVAASVLARALKLHVLLQRFGAGSGMPRMLRVSLATDFAFMTTPAGVGGYAASIYYLRRSGASVSSAATITATDQIMDVLFFIVALPIAGLGLAWSDAPPTLSLIAFATSTASVVAAMALLLARRPLARWFANLAVSHRWPRLCRAHAAACAFAATVHSDTRFVLAGGPLLLFNVFALTAVQQLARYGVLWLVLILLGHPISFLLTFLLQVFVLQAAVWTGVPSGAGGAELGLSATLLAWVPSASLATALLLWRIATLYAGLVAGAIAIALPSRRVHRTTEPALDPPSLEAEGLTR